MPGSSQKSQSLMQLQDMVSICVFCREDATVIMSVSPDNQLAQFPTTTITNTSWRLTVRKLIGMVNGLSGRDISIMRITKFWTPEGAPLFHIIYKVKCSYNDKKLLKLQTSSIPGLCWLSLERVQTMFLANQLASPELLEYVTQTLQPCQFYPLTGDPEASKEGFDMLNEVVEKHTLIETEANFLTPNEQLLKLANFNRNEQKKIYKEFLLRSFPNLFMNRVQFDRLMGELGWKKDYLPGLFGCADVSSRGGISYRDLLLFLAATDPDTPHEAACRDIRCQYMFRYFDKNRDNIVDPIEMRYFIIALYNMKEGSQKPGEINKAIENHFNELGLGKKRYLRMSSFVKKIGEIKYHGMTTIFRSSLSSLKLVAGHKSEDNSLNFFPQSSNVKPKGFTTLSGMSMMAMGQASDSAGYSFGNRGPQKTYEIATHAVRLNRLGLMEDIRPVDRVQHGKSLSLSAEDHFIRSGSLNYYDQKFPPNELLACLQYFTAETSKAGQNTHKKSAYSWDRFDMSYLQRTLMAVCNMCIKIMEKEPRKINVSSPIYVLGDLHGNYHDLMVYEQVLWSLGLSLTPSSLLFLGDYVDRGAHGVEVVSYLFAQKARNPNKMFLLRGNHEIRSIQKSFTFYTECQRKFGEDNFYEVWDTINRVFDVMPLCAVIDSKLFCCHGGIPAPWLCSRIETIDTIPCPLASPEEESILAWEIMWNDPVKTDQMPPAVIQEMEANEGFALNLTRKTAKVFSPDALDSFLRKNDLSHMIRAHEVKTAGFQIQQGGKLLTVFSSSGYCGGPNEAASLFVCDEKIRVFRINTSM